MPGTPLTRQVPPAQGRGKDFGQGLESQGIIEQLKKRESETTAVSEDVDQLRGRVSGQVVDYPTASQDNYEPTDIANAQSVVIIPSVCIKITGVKGGFSGRVLTLSNGTSGAGARLIILEDESGTSATENRFSHPGKMPVFLAPGQSVTYFYNRIASRWCLIDHLDLARQFDWFDDLLAWSQAAGPINTNVAVAGAIALVGGPGTAADSTIGAVQFDTAASATGRVHYVAPSNVGTPNMVNPVKGCMTFLTRLMVDTLSTGAQRYNVRAGWHDGGATITDGIYWEYDDSVSGDWRTCITGAAASTKNTVTGFTVATGQYYWLGFFVNEDWTQVEFFYSSDGRTWTIFATASTGANIPVAGEQATFNVAIAKTIGATSRTMNLDLVAFRYPYARGT